MSKKLSVLALYYSQTGRTKDVLEHFLRPLRENAQVEVEMVRIEPQQPFPYPWPVLRVLSTFPEVVLEKPVPLNPFPFDENRKYDLVVLGGQVWFLSCSLPLVSFFHSPAGKVLKHTPVIPILTYRRAWSQGLECIERHIGRLGGTLLGKVVIRAQDKVTFPLLRVLRNEPRAEGEKEYGFDPEELERIGRLGRQVAAGLGENPTALVATQDHDAMVLPRKRPREEMTVPERLIEDYEPAQKQRYLRFARLITMCSSPGTMLRYVVTALLTPLFVPPVYWGIPLLIVAHWVRARLRPASVPRIPPG